MKIQQVFRNLSYNELWNCANVKGERKGVTSRHLTDKQKSGISGSAINKIVTRFNVRISKDKKLNSKTKKIVSSGEM